MTLRSAAKRVLPPKVFGFLRDLVYPKKINHLEDRLNGFSNTYYQSIASPALSQKTALKNAEFKVFSKHGCDGLLLFLFSKVGVTNRTFVEIGIQDGRECNTANLSINFGWKGLLIDANKEWVEEALHYYKGALGSMNGNVHVVESMVTAENINSVLSQNKITGEIDLLSIDIDSNDYWVWKAVTAINPRVVVIEYNASCGPTPSIVMKYDPHFAYQEFYREHPLYYGASVSALTKLAREKGYILVGCDVHGGDAYFVRNDVAHGTLVELSSEEAFYPNSYRLEAIGDTKTQYAQLQNLEFEHV